MKYTAASNLLVLRVNDSENLFVSQIELIKKDIKMTTKLAHGRQQAGKFMNMSEANARRGQK